MSGRPLALLLAAPVASLVLLTGCGDETGTGGDVAEGSTSGAVTSPGPSEPTSSTGPTDPADPTSSAAASTLPRCDDVWVAGAVLPAGYRGCSDGTADVLPQPLRCSTGQKIVTYDPYWAVPGAEVQETTGLAEDPAFASVKNQCQA